ncbi:hypothetical protein CPB86DRAFT_786848 [Serendipita vermifera]|nr:hypothetical protein CPB86DRAFT_786848 [Serendipita vermifera]
MIFARVSLFLTFASVATHNFCSIGTNGEEICTPNDSGNPSDGSSSTYVPLPGTTDGPAVANNSNGNNTTNDESEADSDDTNGAPGAVSVERSTLLVIGAASLAITFL